ncbi:uncharacterized protein LOC119726958 [Patiria miniata]|uniref:Uncharacterized protein n=1 Tax=Patiria miniata TaxID=46514 RepID=A0A913ZU36_PATMI|nr:uncharacterized protein LOC119726958 [Patiria miniata]
MFATPQRHQTVDKENVGAQVKTPGKTLNPLVTPVRKPLASLNQDVTASHNYRSSAKMVQKIWTPVKHCTPTRLTSANKTRGRQSKKHRKGKDPSVAWSSCKRTALSVTEAAESLLNQVLLKEISACSHLPKESGTEWMEPLSSISDGDQLLEQTVSGLVDSAIHAALQELRNEKVQGATCSIPTKTSSTESLALDPVTPTTDGLWSIALGLDESYNNSGQGQDDTSVFLEDNLSGISSELSLAKGMAAGCSPVMKISKPCFTPANHHEGQETRLAPTIHQDNISIDADGENSNNHMRSRRLVLGLPGSTPIASHQMIQGTDSVQKVVQKLEMTNMALVELEPLMKVVPAEIAIRSSCTVPIELPHTSHGTRPDDRANTSVAMTPVKTMQTDSMTSATNVAGVAVGSTPVHSNITAMMDSSVGVTPVKSYSIFTGTTPHKPILKDR